MPNLQSLNRKIHVSSITYKKIILIFSGLGLVLLTAILYLRFGENQTIELQRVPITAYDDRIEIEQPGNSEAISFWSDADGFKFSYLLKKGFAYPYAGFSIALKDSSGNFFDCTDFDAIKISIISSELSDCKLYLKLFDQKFSVKSDELSERYLLKDLMISAVPSTYTIPFKQFSTPNWWYQKNNITLMDVSSIDFSKVTALRIESGATAKTDITDTITISKITLVRRWNMPLILLLSLLLAAILFIVTKNLIKIKNKKIKKSPLIITYEKKDIGNYRDTDAQRISDYIAKHFSEPQLSILTAGTELGFSQKKIAKIMNDVFKMSFKQYITSIRIHEAKRMLNESDRLVIDIALAVGFNNVSHFNRVFKTIEEMSPLEFRNRKQA